MRRYFWLIALLFLSFTFAREDLNASFEAETNATLQKEMQRKLDTLRVQIANIDATIKDNIWLIRYENYAAYQRLLEELTSIDEQIKIFSKRKDDISKAKIKELSLKQNNLEKQLELLQEFKISPFLSIVKPDDLAPKPNISSPFAIFTALSYIKLIEKDRADYNARITTLDLLIKKLQEKRELVTQVVTLFDTEENQQKLLTIDKDLIAFDGAHELAQTTYSLYTKKVDEIKYGVTNEIKEQMERALNIAVFVIIVIVLSLIFKMIAKKYIKDNERYYMANKIINFINITLILIILLFAYIENVSYLVTVLGFASAGIAIAMKDWFMSILGWLVIVFGGSFHVGDRIKVLKDGAPYVGDIIDISLLRMTIFEDITLTTYMENRRSGRVFFVPNNFIFTTLISNYTHGTLKTVWDGIDVTITFDSNHKKALYIIKEITKKYSKGYTDIARRNLNQLRHQYSLKNTNVEPRIFSFYEPYGLVISTWYMTNSYAALTLRSNISADIVDAINKEDDITIAYPTQTINLKYQRKTPLDIDINKDVLF
ncbi:MAG: mechanosensitive ion channel [Sulfurospirillum sp.]|nr:mechanosensitive ion channel [Sulfurospirillum sp.]